MEVVKRNKALTVVKSTFNGTKRVIGISAAIPMSIIGAAFGIVGVVMMHATNKSFEKAIEEEKKEKIKEV